MSRLMLGLAAFAATLLIGVFASSLTTYVVTRPQTIAQDSPDPAIQLSDELAVYRALMKEEGLDESKILIVNETYKWDPDGATAVGVADKERNADFNEKLKASASLQTIFAGTGIGLISREELDKLPEKDFWNAFHERYPNASGILTLSRVGFDRRRTEATVRFANSCGWLCGHGGTWIFTKNNGEWKKSGSIGPEWVS